MTENHLTRRNFITGIGATTAGLFLSSCAVSGDRSAKGLTEEALAVTPVVKSQDLEKSDITVGYVPVNDCAPFAIAWKKGFFRKYGLNVTLNREASWATSSTLPPSFLVLLPTLE
jgi:nitrate/nitrite transport system substrate-binding protein